MKIGKLTILEKDLEKSGGKRTYFICKCDCGKIKSIRRDSLFHKKHPTQSCGCLIKERHPIEHGDSRTKLYHVWATMKDRCSNSNRPCYKHYGGRGIKVCDEWNGSDKWLNFKKWALENGYKDGLTLDRIDVNGNYEPNNCRWIPLKEQINNTRRNIYLTYKNETHNINQWAKILGINKNTFWVYVRKKKYSLEYIIEHYNCKV